MADLKQSISNGLKLIKNPLIDHLGDLVKAIPGIVAVSVVIIEILKDIDEKKKELVKPALDILQSLEKLDEAEKKAKLEELEKIKNDHPEIIPTIEKVQQKYAQKTLEKAKEEGSKLALVTGISLGISNGIDKDTIQKMMDFILINSTDDLMDIADQNGSTDEYKKALGIVIDFIDEYYYGIIDEDEEMRPGVNENGDYKWDITDEAFSFNFCEDIQEADPEGHADIPYFDTLFNALNTICDPGNNKKAFSDYYLYGFEKEEVEEFQE